MYSELLIGCGNNREKRMGIAGTPKEWKNLTTLDVDPLCNPDVWFDLNNLPYPFEDNQFDEIHAYEVLEHVGAQGDHAFFFAQFGELFRILKPDGLLFGTVPAWNSIWAWGDPSHRRVISRASLTYLGQAEYKKQVGTTPMTDFRGIWKHDMPLVWYKEEADTFHFTLQAKKNAS